MRKAILLVIALSFSGLQAASLDLGSDFPKLEKEIAVLKGTDGKDYTIDGVKKPAGTLVIFSCNHCPYAVAWEERIAQIGNKYSKTWKDPEADASAQGNPPVGVIMINSNDPSANPIDNMDGMKERAKALKLEFPYVMDTTSKVAKAYGATKTPEVFLFDSKGKLVYKGAVDDNYKAEKMKETWLIDAVEAVSKGIKPKLQSTKAIGCSIKFRS